MLEEWNIEQRYVFRHNCIQYREIFWSLYSIGSPYGSPITADIMPSSHAESHTGRCLQSNIQPWQHSKSRLLRHFKIEMANTQFIVELLILTSPTALIWNQWIFTNARRNKVLNICAQMKTATRPDADLIQGLKRFCDLVSIFYAPYWLQCPSASEAAVNDLEF